MQPARVVGPLPPSLRELASSLTYLDLTNSALTLLPTELGALTGLDVLDLGANQLMGVPAEFRTWGPSKPLRFVR